jgi:hypothetical protein
MTQTRGQTDLPGYEERFAITKPTDDESNPFEKNFTVVACGV